MHAVLSGPIRRLALIVASLALGLSATTAIAPHAMAAPSVAIVVDQPSRSVSISEPQATYRAATSATKDSQAVAAYNSRVSGQYGWS